MQLNDAIQELLDTQPVWSWLFGEPVEIAI